MGHVGFVLLPFTEEHGGAVGGLSPLPFSSFPGAHRSMHVPTTLPGAGSSVIWVFWAFVLTEASHLLPATDKHQINLRYSRWGIFSLVYFTVEPWSWNQGGMEE